MKAEAEAEAEAEEHTSIILVNWNGAKDTIDCLDSINRLSVSSTKISVVIVDNASADDSLEQIGSHLLRCAYELRAFSLSDMETGRVESEAWYASFSHVANDICVVAAKKNLGFAAGNNIGIHIALAVKRPSFLWLLNNDTEVAPDSLDLLVHRMQDEPSIGICGCTIAFFEARDIVQAYGGSVYSPITGRGQGFGVGSALDKARPNGEAEARISYVSGASMFVRQTLIQKVGSMSEDYFLYNEELDWAYRSRKHFRLGVETAAVVFHKEGASIGTESKGRSGSPLSTFFQTRSKLLFAKRHTPLYVPTVWLALFARACKQFVLLEHVNALTILSVLFGRRQPSATWFQRNDRLASIRKGKT
jgi:GT2 family glycosyltransferase